MKELHSDILIVGGGLTGLLAAFALSILKKDIIIVDRYDFVSQNLIKLDSRTTAIAEGSKKFLQEIDFLYLGQIIIFMFKLLMILKE